LELFKASWQDWAGDVAGLLFPRRCSACDSALYRHEKILCTACRADLPLARFHDDPLNRIEQLFQGRIQLTAASAFLLFNRAGMVQRLLHRLKYKGDLDLGIHLGCMMAEDIKTAERFKDVDALMAVPLHSSREHRRGYNQSQVIVEGMSRILKLPCIKHGLKRISGTRSQTRKGRLSRWTHVKDAFEVVNETPLREKHVLLVDDVVTTGATVEGCAKAMSQVPGLRLSLYAAACA
jgi:competence protein ComFC